MGEGVRLTLETLLENCRINIYASYACIPTICLISVRLLVTFRFYNKGKAVPNVIIPFFSKREENWKNWSTINCLQSPNQWQSMNRNNTSLENTLLVFSVCLHSLLCWPSLQSYISQALELQERWGEDQVSVSIFALCSFLFLLPIPGFFSIPLVLTRSITY